MEPSASRAVASLQKVASNSTYEARRTFGGGLYDSTANKTFICWTGQGMDIYVRAYNHASNTWEAESRLIDRSETDENAYHDYPVMILGPDGRVRVFYVAHTSALYMLTAPSAHSLGGAWAKQTVSTDRNCYPMPVVSGSSIYVFYSRDDDQSWPYRSYKYIKSADNGTTWSRVSNCIDTGKTSDKFNEVYAFGVKEYQGKIYVTWVMSGGPNGHNAQSKSLYAAFLNTQDNLMYSFKGNSCSFVVDANDLAKCLVRAADNTSVAHPIANSQPAVAGDGTFCVAYSVFDGSVNDNRVEFARYASGSVKLTTVHATGEFQDMISPNGRDWDVLYYSKTGKTIHAKRSSDSGTTWSLITSIALPYENGADSICGSNFIDNGSTIKAILPTMNWAQAKTDYSGKWPVFTLTY